MENSNDKLNNHYKNHLNYISNNKYEYPRIIISKSIIEKNYKNFEKYFNNFTPYYAIKANPEKEILSLLNDLGSYFDAASIFEIKLALDLGVAPSRISYGNTVKKTEDIKKAFDLGINLFVFDCEEEVEKIAKYAPNSKVFCRFLCDNGGAEWPLSRKFGCPPENASWLLLRAKELGLNPIGLSFHAGSQQTNPARWERAIWEAANIFSYCEDNGLELSLLNLGGGFPVEYTREIPELEDYSTTINRAIDEYFGKKIDIIFEPGRAMVANSGLLECEVVLATRKSPEDPNRWIYIDIGLFTGLAETMGEAIEYQFIFPDNQDDDNDYEEAIYAGPTCDSADIMYEKKTIPSPLSLKDGDKILILATGAYTHTYASQCFNGFPPPQAIVID